MEQNRGPFPGVGFKEQVAANSPFPMQVLFSGEIVNDFQSVPVGAANYAGRISAPWLSVLQSGKDDTNTLSLTVDILINGTSCLTTAPIIAHVSGEASTNKTTKTDDDTGVTQAVVDPDNNTVSEGDFITCDVTLTRTASPTTEMEHLAVAVPIYPV